MYSIKTIIITVLILFNSFSVGANILIVTSLADNNTPGTLRYELINNASNGDTIFISVKGIVFLNNNLNINKNVTIVGFYPIHTKIAAASSFSGTQLLTISANVNIQKIGIQNISALPNLTGIQIAAGSLLSLTDATIKSFTARGISNDGTLECLNVSLISNTFMTADGGAVINNTGANAKFINCTFYSNSATSAGAISNYATLKLIHNTFYNNSSTAGSYIQNNNGQVTIQNNIFSSSGIISLVNAGTNWLNNGGNVYEFSPVGFINTGTGDTFSATPGLRTNILIDGYGLEYFTLQSNSSAIDRGTLSTDVPEKDCRRAPRILQASSQIKPDAGAVEYSPYRVVNSNSSGAGSLPQQIININVSTYPGPFYIDFDIAMPSPIITSTTLNINKNKVIIDGYTQPNSAIWGPGTTITTTTPFVLPIEINCNNNDGFIIVSDTCIISGIKLTNSDNAIYCSNTNDLIFYGNFITNSNKGILADYLENLYIGFESLHTRNVINNCNSYGIDAENSLNVNISNNFIGTDVLGNTSSPNNTGIKIENCHTVKIYGDYRYLSGNLISGNANNGIEISSSSYNVEITGNIIGADRIGLNALPNETGIEVKDSSENVFIGNSSLRSRNLISGNLSNGIYINNNVIFSNTFKISNNFIGVNYFGTTPLANLQNGIYATNSNNIEITENIISANKLNGFLADNGSNNIVITGNIIGLNQSQNTALPNGHNGIKLFNANNIQIGLVNALRNVISGNDSTGIYFVNATLCQVANTSVGVNLSGNNFGNGQHGIFVNNSYNIKIGSVLDSVIIANNNRHGVLITGSTTNAINVSRCIITDNVLLGISLGGTTPLPNDTGDNDNGPNELQNYPIIQAKNCGNTTNVSGQLDVISGTQYRIDFYETSVPADPTGHGEAKKYIQSYFFIPSANGTYTFNTIIPFVQSGSYITATASKEVAINLYATSEFSPNVQVSSVNINVNSSITTPSCYNDVNGSISASVTGGVTPYTFILYDTNYAQLGTTQTGTSFYNNQLGAGTYYLYIEDAAGCTLMDTFIINQPAALSLNHNLTHESCLGFNDGVIVFLPSGGTPPYQYSIDGTTYVTTPAFTNLSPGIYALYLTDNNGCSYTVAVSINQGVPQPSPPAFSSGSYQFCLTAQPVTANGNTGNFNWYSDAGLNNLIFNGPSYTSVTSGLATYYVTQSVNTCESNPATVNIEIIDNLAVNDGSPYIGCANIPLQIQVSTPYPSSTINWVSNPQMTDYTQFNPIITLATSNYFFYTVDIPYLQGTCSISDSINVYIDNTPDCGLTSTYNAFSPNGDGINDTWIIDGAYYHPVNRVTIFNRWGNKLVTLENYDNVNVVWDGRYKGEILPSGTYFYLIEFFEANKSITGWVQITR